MTRTILLVVEDDGIAHTLSPILEAEGFAVVVEADGRWALRLFEKRQFDVVIAGDRSGRKGGLELAEGIRKIDGGRAVPMLMIAEKSRKRSILEAARRTYDLADILATPLSPERLIAALKQVLADRYPDRADVASARLAVDRKSPAAFAGPDSEREQREVEKNSARFQAAARRGSLTDTPFPALLGQLYQEKASGAVLLERDKHKKVVYLQGGYPVVVRSNRLEECLGRALVRSGQITQSQCAASLAKMKASGNKQGTILVSMGLLSPSSLQRVLVSQLQMKLFEPFSWTTGSYRFDPAAQVPAATVTLTATPATLIYRGIRKRMSQAQMEALLAPFADRFPQPNADPLLRFQVLALSPDEQGLRERIRPDRPLATALPKSGEAREAMLALTCALTCAGMITFSEQEPPQSLDDPEALAGVTETEVDEPSVPTAPVSPPGRELTQVRRSLADELERKRELDFFALLDVPRDADGRQIGEAFRQLARRFHPDHATNFGSTLIRRLNVQMFDLVCQAHRVLGDDSERRRYIEELEGPPKTKSLPEKLTLKGPAASAQTPARGEASAEAPRQLTAKEKAMRRALRAQSLYNQAEAALKRKDFAEARRLLEEVIDLCPDEAEYRAQLGLALFRSDPDNTTVVRQARDQLNQAILQSPRLDRAHVFLAEIYRRMGQRAMCIHEYEQALECNPRCAEALRGLKLLRSQGKKKKKGLGGLLSKWKR